MGHTPQITHGASIRLRRSTCHQSILAPRKQRVGARLRNGREHPRFCRDKTYSKPSHHRRYTTSNNSRLHQGQKISLHPVSKPTSTVLATLARTSHGLR